MTTCNIEQLLDFPGGSVVKNPPAMQETQEMMVPSLGGESPLKEGMATHSSIITWRIPQTEESGRLQSIGSQRVDMTEMISTHIDIINSILKVK